MSQKKYWTHPGWSRSSPDSPAANALYGQLCQLLIREVDLPEDAAILDAGTGHGPLMVHLSRAFPNTTGIDFSEHMVSLNPCRDRVVIGSVMDMPFEDESFDLVVCSALLHHLSPDEQEKTLREFARVSREAVAVFEPRRMNPAMFLFGLLKKEERGIIRLSRRRLRRLFSQAALEVAAEKVHGLVLPNMMDRFPLRLVLPAASALGRTWLASVLGFYVLVVGRKMPGRNEGSK